MIHAAIVEYWHVLPQMKIKYIIIYPQFKDVVGPYQRTLNMFYTPMLSRSSSKVIGNYHRILVNEHPINMSTFKVRLLTEVSCPCQFINFYIFKMKYFVRNLHILHQYIYQCPHNHIKLHDTRFQCT